jgi:Putative motility protein
MTISGQNPGSLLDSVLTAQTTRVDIGVSMLKKAQDVEKQEGAALVQMLEKSGVKQGESSALLDTYA